MIGSPRRLAFLLALGFMLSDAAPLQAQSYPDKPIRIIVAAAAGGPDDFPAASRHKSSRPKFGQPVVVENGAGAGGALGRARRTRLRTAIR